MIFIRVSSLVIRKKANQDKLEQISSVKTAQILQASKKIFLVGSRDIWLQETHLQQTHLHQTLARQALHRQKISLLLCPCSKVTPACFHTAPIFSHSSASLFRQLSSRCHHRAPHLISLVQTVFLPGSSSSLNLLILNHCTPACSPPIFPSS